MGSSSYTSVCVFVVSSSLPSEREIYFTKYQITIFLLGEDNVFCVYVPLCNHFRCENKQWRRGKRTVFFMFPFVFLVWLLLILGFNSGSWPRWKMDMLKKKKKWKKVYTPGCVCVCMSVEAKVLIRYRLLGSASRLRESTPRVYIFPILALHTHTPPLLYFLFHQTFFSVSQSIWHTQLTPAPHSQEGEVVIRGGRGVEEIFPFFFIRESCPNSLTPPLYAKDFFREFHRPKFFLFLCIIKQKLG